jgi:hypothetical protein
MLPQDVYFVDLDVVYTLLYKNLWYVTKLLFMAYIMFYYLPVKIFPQEHIKSGVQKIVFNFIYMTAYVELVVAFLVLIKAFSLIFFLLVLFLTKLGFLHFYYKQDIWKVLDALRVKLMLRTLEILDNPRQFRQKIAYYLHEKIVNLQNSITLYSFSKKILFFSVFAYIFTVLIARGLLSYGDPLPDTAQFMEWVASLQKNILYADYKTFGADFYGISVLIFFVNIFTNIDQIILFSIYPLLLIIALYTSIYYVVKDFTSSAYVALFAVMFHGIVLMSPFANYFLGDSVATAHPSIVNIYGLKFYMPSVNDVFNKSYQMGFSPYIRYVTGMAYEHASVFVLLNAYFLIRILQTHLRKYLIVYSLTLMLVFIFHGGGAIVLVVISILVALSALIFKKINKKILKEGILAILIASIFGNLWILSMAKYGIPPEFGAAAPFLDKFLNTKGLAAVHDPDILNISIINITTLQITFFIMLFAALIGSLFTRNRFVNTAYLMIVFGIYIVYFGPNAGLPLLTKQYRVADYMLMATTLLGSFYFYYIFYRPSLLIFKKYFRTIIVIVFYFVFIFTVLSFPRWIDTNDFWKNINWTQYTSIPDIILKINKENRPFTWTAVAYVQSYGKIKNKGYHVNTQNFLLEYNPSAEFLTIPTQKVYIFVENFPNAYRGMEEWYYRWRRKIQDNMKVWITIYSMNHKNIKLYAKTKTVSVYEIDNSAYIEQLTKKEEK